VVIGGGISEAGEFYFEALRERVARRAMPVCGAGTRIVAATRGNRAGGLGAAGLIINE
ncbi:MAG: ROK family protein, partial [Alistipes sp.]|nr:ROK family protein [Alistipes sp.]